MFEFKSWDHFQHIFGSIIEEKWVFNPEPIKEYLIDKDIEIPNFDSQKDFYSWAGEMFNKGILKGFI